MSIFPGNLGSINPEQAITPEQGSKLMEEMNILLVTDPICVKQYREFFKVLQEESNIPLLYHCSAGKDRTGMASVLILYALGVDDATILDDYLASNTYLSGKYEALMAKNPVYKDLFSVKKEYLEAGLNSIKKEYGSIDAFLTEILGVNIENFRKRYLY
jgi:protein-tyrosine phosphatase